MSPMMRRRVRSGGDEYDQAAMSPIMRDESDHARRVRPGGEVRSGGDESSPAASTPQIGFFLFGGACPGGASSCARLSMVVATTLLVVGECPRRRHDVHLMRQRTATISGDGFQIVGRLSFFSADGGPFCSGHLLHPHSDGRDRINHSFESVPVQNYAKCMMCCH
ncbi:hypothetical protein M6B38_338540 [Iris pallida]|uniref:Uncharacterized protein n=1 Tax=Iris pallida TaxID=29817 RepID=A0AAX6GZG7_IRIPA|nr:hypothetical protein M6B38_338540 [Iris pallida]